MNLQLNTRFSVPLSASLLLMTVGSAGALECPNQPPTANKLTRSTTGAELSWKTGELGTDADFDWLNPVPISDETYDRTATGGGKLVIVEGAEGAEGEVKYTPPTSPTAEFEETFKYGIKDKHNGEDLGGTLTITVTAPPPKPTCGQAGDDCWQTWDGRWFTLQDELAGKVISLDGKKTPVALFYPSKAAYLNPDPAYPPNVIAIFPNVISGRESYWGCGPVNAVTSATIASCDLSQSLRGDVTYLLRLPVVNGLIPMPTIKVASSAYVGDTYRSYFFALSRTPGKITFTGNVPSNELAGCTGVGSLKNFSSTTCPNLRRSSYKPAGTEMLYLKIQATPGTVFNTTTQKWNSNEQFKECDNEKDCRLYVQAW